jgi:hypothetical protein
VDKFASSIAEIESVISKSKDEISSIDAKLPEMQNEKKNAVASKNFKKAAQVTKEVKEAEETKQSLQKKIVDLEKDLVDQKNEIDQQNQKREEIEDQLAELEKTFDKERFDMLVQKRKDLRVVLRDLSRSVTDQSAERTFLTIDYSESVAETERLARKYQWDIADDTPEEVEDDVEDQEQPGAEEEDEEEPSNIEQKDDAQVASSPAKHVIDDHVSERSPSPASRHDETKEATSPSHDNPEPIAETEDMKESPAAEEEPAEEEDTNEEEQQPAVESEEDKAERLRAATARLAEIEDELNKYNAAVEECISRDAFDEADENQQKVDALEQEKVKLSAEIAQSQ